MGAQEMLRKHLWLCGAIVVGVVGIALAFTVTWFALFAAVCLAMVLTMVWMMSSDRHGG